MDAPSNPDRPLDELFQPRTSRKPTQAPLHPYALEFPFRTRDATLQESSHNQHDGALVFTCWSDADSAVALHRAARDHIEGALLSQLARPAADLRSVGSLRLKSLWLVSFAKNPLPEAALHAFGLQPVTSDSVSEDHRRRVIARLRGEAQSSGMPDPGEPTGWFQADIARAEIVDKLEADMLNSGESCRWGTPPGGLYRLLSQTLHHPAVHDRPNLATVAALESLLCPAATGALRWMPPLAFQALCDLVGIMIAQLGTETAWASADSAEGDTDDEDAAPLPPLLRVGHGESSQHLPVGEALLRWCIMPRQPGETIPPLADWVRDVAKA